MIGPLPRIVLPLIAVVLAIAPAWAWKPSTHQPIAVRAAVALPPGDLRDLLLANAGYLRGGSMGPDLFYTAGPPNWHYSDLAHCGKTEELAKP